MDEPVANEESSEPISSPSRKGKVTCPSRKQFFEQMESNQGRSVPSQTRTIPSDGLIDLDKETTYQTIEGFGVTLTGGSAMHLKGMPSEQRSALLQELFGDELQLNTLRLSMGASDLDEEPYSYDDLPEGVEEDLELEHFSLDRDRVYKIPILKEIKRIQRNLKIIATPWSPPMWMKTNKSFVGGELRQEYYAAYAKYFVKYIREMESEGLPIHAITIQNEPLHDGNNPSMYMPAEAQADFIGNHLAPAFEQARIRNVKIIAYDHNADNIDYPMQVMGNSKAGQCVDGSAFHLYGGDISALSKVHDAFPDKDIYFTEQWVSSDGQMEGDLMWHAQNVLIGALSNWASIVLQWNLSSNKDMTPHTPGGCDKCLGAVTIDGASVVRNTAYYLLGHASSAIPSGSKRIKSSWSRQKQLRGSQGIESDVDQVAFLRPDGEIVLLLANRSKNEIVISVSMETTQVTLPGRSLTTLIL